MVDVQLLAEGYTTGVIELSLSDFSFPFYGTTARGYV